MVGDHSGQYLFHSWAGAVLPVGGGAAWCGIGPVGAGIDLGFPGGHLFSLDLHRAVVFVAVGQLPAASAQAEVPSGGVLRLFHAVDAGGGGVCVAGFCARPRRRGRSIPATGRNDRSNEGFW